MLKNRSRVRAPAKILLDGLQRIVITNVFPSVEHSNLYPIKRVLGDELKLTADIFIDGHEKIAACVQYKHIQDKDWDKVSLIEGTNDEWYSHFLLNRLGFYHFQINAWHDEILTWQDKFAHRNNQTDKDVDLLILASYIEQALHYCADQEEQKNLNTYLNLLNQNKDTTLFLSARFYADLRGYLPIKNQTTSPVYEIMVERDKANFSTWYELFPRSEYNGHGPGNFNTLKKLLPRIKAMGFDVLYLPPIHPIGTKARKGKNNTLSASADEPGSPWAIGNHDGGHKDIHHDLGDFKDFEGFIELATNLGLEIAMDYALQCSPDHPYLHDHPEWFKKRPDGTLQYAENPPKKYQDIYPFDFSSPAWQSLWQECKAIILFWIKKGIKIFRVDNPHTKPFAFWAWLIREVKLVYPEVLFLSEAFTGPKIKYHLAKIGFSQSYTYFIWKNTKEELEEYLSEITSLSVSQFFRANFWPNTPDILHKTLQDNGQVAFTTRLLLAATLSSNYGIYGPPYEMLEHTALKSGSEEYLNSEKYETRSWDLSQSKMADFITLINQLRMENKALQQMASLRFHPTDNPKIMCYSKHDAFSHNLIIVVVNLDFKYKQTAWLDLHFAKSCLKYQSFKVMDLLTQETYQWRLGKNYVELTPTGKNVAHLLKVITI